MSNTPFYADLHVHTNRSACAPRTTEVASYLPCCASEGIRVMGITNHVYADDILHDWGCTERDHVTYLTSLRSELKAAEAASGIRFLLGCEIENFASVGHPNLLPEESLDFDYVLVAASHVLNQRHMYVGYDIETPDGLRALTVERFLSACDLSYPVPMAICHPLYPIGCPFQAEVLDGISDGCLNECFSKAAERHIGIEAHACLYRTGTPLNDEGLSERYLRLLEAAKSCGCKFYMGSDAHTPDAFTGVHDKLRRAMEIVGITEADRWEPSVLD